MRLVFFSHLLINGDLLFARIAGFFKLASHASLIESIVSNCITKETRISEKVH